MKSAASATASRPLAWGRSMKSIATVCPGGCRISGPRCLPLGLREPEATRSLQASDSPLSMLVGPKLSITSPHIVELSKHHRGRLFILSISTDVQDTIEVQYCGTCALLSNLLIA